MLLHLLAVGDVVAQGGLDCLHRHLRRLKEVVFCKCVTL